MKNNRIILLITVCLMTPTINGLAQTRSITKRQYEAVQRIAEANIDKISNKSATKVEEYSDGQLNKTSIINEETIPPKKMKYTEVETSGDKTTKLEIVNIDYIEYKRENDGVWVKKDLSKSDKDDDPGVVIEGQESPNKKKYTVENSNFNNQAVRIYTVSTIYNSEPNLVISYRRWINSNNLILKSEEISTEIDSGNITRREVVTYEYNPKNLKIEAPVK